MPGATQPDASTAVQKRVAVRRLIASLIVFSVMMVFSVLMDQKKARIARAVGQLAGAESSWAIASTRSAS